MTISKKQWARNKRNIKYEQASDHPATGKVKKLILDVPKLLKNPAISEAVENLLDVLAVQAIKDRNETGRPWEDVKKELDKKHSLLS